MKNEERHKSKEEKTVAVGIADGHLEMDIGIEAFGGVFVPLIKRGSSVPLVLKQIFSTANDNQTKIEFTIFEGIGVSTINDCMKLGVFVLSGIPSDRGGIPQIELKFDVSTQGELFVSAVDLGRTVVIDVIRRE